VVVKNQFNGAPVGAEFENIGAVAAKLPPVSSDANVGPFLAMNCHATKTLPTLFSPLKLS
jgi:hypothetical protein